jgi:hypothetical protein
MGTLEHYVIRGGVEGRQRLRVMSRVLHSGTAALLDRAGIGTACVVWTSAVAEGTSRESWGTTGGAEGQGCWGGWRPRDDRAGAW